MANATLLGRDETPALSLIKEQNGPGFLIGLNGANGSPIVAWLQHFRSPPMQHALRTDGESDRLRYIEDVREDVRKTMKNRGFSDRSIEDMLENGIYCADCGSRTPHRVRQSEHALWAPGASSSRATLEAY